MRRVLSFVMSLILAFVSAKPGLAEETKYYFQVSPYLVEGSEKEPSIGHGGFIVSENRYGRFSLTYYNKWQKFSITAIGEVQSPVTRLINETISPATADEITLAVDLYLKASPSKTGLVHVEGVMIIMSPASTMGAPVFEYSEGKLDFEIPNNGTYTVPMGDDYNGKQVYLEISLRTDAELVYKEKITRHVFFDTEYDLYNQDTQEYEIQGKGCILGLDLDTREGETTCFWEKVYRLSGGDSLLYTTAYSIRNPTYVGSGKIEFQLEVSHIYALNPVTKASRQEELNSEKTTVVLFNKEITATVGERTEIEIPQEENSLLPFKSKETMVLINSVKEIKQ